MPTAALRHPDKLTKKDFDPRNRIDKEKLVLTRPFDKHLDNDELDELVSLQAQGVRESGHFPDGGLGEAQRHVESCEDCKRKVQMHERVQSEISRLGASSVPKQGAQCPQDVDWLHVAAGLLPESQTRELMLHAAQCRHCGPLLRTGVESLADEATPHEESLLAELSSARPQWQRHLAARLRGSAKGVQRRKGHPSWWASLISWPRPLFVAGTLAVLFVVGWLSLSRLRAPSAEHLLALAYTERRTLEVRIPEAQYAPMRVERSTGGSSLDKPPDLLKAEALIAENLRRNPTDPTWLQAKARADLLEGNYESAIQSLQRALEGQPDATGLQTDLASAHFLRGSSETGSADYSVAINILGKVLQKHPDDKIALFNRAILLERMFLLGQAADDWEHYLRIDPSGSWSQEASQRLQRLKLKQQSRDKAVLQPLMGPGQLIKQVTSDENTWAPVDSRIEEYHRLIVRDWLSQAFPVASNAMPTSSADQTLRAVRLVAVICRSRHTDNWLDRLLTSPSSPKFPEALSELRNAVIASERADYVLALGESRRSQRLFLQTKNEAGLLRARFEEVFALHFSNNAPECAKQAALLVGDARRAHFEWISLQAQIEQGICKNSQGDYGVAQAVLASAARRADSVEYATTHTRALTMAGLVAWSEGNAEAAWSDLTKGLDRCWADSCPAMTMYSLYANLDNFAEDSRQWYLQVALARQALLVLGDDPDHLMRAVEHNRLAKACVLAHIPNLAREEFAIASGLLASVPQTEVTRHYQAGIRIDLAKLASEEGDAVAAYRYLAEVRPQISQIADHYLLMDYYQTLGHLQLKSREIEKAEESLRWAVAFAERQLASLPSERDRLAWRQLSGNTYRDLVELELVRNDPRSALDIWEWYLGVPLRSAARPQSGDHHPILGDVFSLNQAGKKAPPLPNLDAGVQAIHSLHNSTLISFAILSGKTGAWVSDDRGIYFTWIEGNAGDLVILTQRFKRLCSDRDTDVMLLRVHGQKLYKSLLAPLAGRFLAERTLVFEGDSEIVDIPLQALVDEDGGYLVDRFSVTTLPGVYYTSRLRANSHISPDDPVLVVAVPTTNRLSPGRSYPLPDVWEEAAGVVSRFHGARVLSGAELDEQTLSREIGRAVLFHFAGHASGTRSQAGLILAGTPGSPASTLNASRILALRPSHAQLAVLSACSTESSGEKGMADPDSLALAFLQAGVPHVVASRWNVDSAITTKFMASFYDSVLAGKSVPQSVRDAGLLIRSLSGVQHPYYWAAFSSFGSS